MNPLRRILKEIKSFFGGMNKALIEQSIEVLELEAVELEHTFLSIVLGSIVGIPLMPIGLAIELAPLLEKEINILVSRTWRAGDTLADFFSSLGGEW